MACIFMYVWVCVCAILAVHIFSYPLKQCMVVCLEQGSVRGHTIKDNLHDKYVQFSLIKSSLWVCAYVTMIKCCL